MNFEPPEMKPEAKYGSCPVDPVNRSENYYNNRQQYKSCLLSTPKQEKYEFNTCSANQNRNVGPFGHKQYKAPVHNRLGSRNFNRNLPVSQESKNGIGQNGRKRFIENNNFNYNSPKRKWTKTPFVKQQFNSTYSAQNRMKRIRNSAEFAMRVPHNDLLNDTTPPFVNVNDGLEGDVTDFTVQVVNNIAPRSYSQDEPDAPVKFKMLLDSRIQTAIKTIQMKRRDKQVIIPIPVTPNVTLRSLHDRFSTL